MQWVCFAVLQLLKICLGIWIIKLVFPEIQIKAGYGRVLTIVLLFGIAYLQIDDYWNCFMSYGNLLVVGILTGLICAFAVEEERFPVFVLCWFYNVSAELLKMPCLVMEGITYEETLFWANYGARNWGEAIWSLFILLGIFLVVYRKKDTLSNMKKLLEKYGRSIFLLGGVEWILLTFVMWMGGRKAFSATALLVAFLGMISVILLFLYLLLKIVWQEAENEKNLLKTSQELMMKHHEELKDVYTKSNQRMHDTKHVILYLKNCLMEQRVEDAMQQLDSFAENLQNSQKIIWTGFDFPDFLINTKKAVMDAKGIRLGLEVDLTHIPMADAELGVLLGNLFDNAIEAAEKCPPENRDIYLKFCNRNEMFYLRMYNTSTSCPKVRNERFISTKSGDIHGFGIENVRTIVDKYQGSMEFRYDTTYFEVSILI